MTERETFAWFETANKLRDLLSQAPLERDRNGRALLGDGLRFVPPVVLGLGDRSPDDYLEQLPTSLGIHLIILMQAGAAALGLWHDDDLVRHKVFKKYVVRGRGRAQPTHRKTQGKSRYGSRLRLQNARALLVDVNRRLTDWLDEDGPADGIFYSCPVRLWADVFAAPVSPPFAKADAQKIPIGVRIPGFDELLRVRRSLLRGTIERS